MRGGETGSKVVGRNDRYLELFLYESKRHLSFLLLGIPGEYSSLIYGNGIETKKSECIGILKLDWNVVIYVKIA